MASEIAYHVWHLLHLRAAKGEPLTPEEQQTLDAAYNQLDKSMPLRFNPSEISQARQTLNALIDKYRDNEEQWRSVEREIHELESQLSPEERAEIGLTG